MVNIKVLIDLKHEKIFMPSKNHKLIQIDRKTWLHMTAIQLKSVD